MAAILDTGRRKSSLKLLSQSQLNFAEMILGWSPFKIVSVSFFLICIIIQNRQKFKVHKKSSNTYSKGHHYAYTVQIWALSGLK
jgi:hypothetical protein